MPALTLKLDRLIELFAESVSNDALPVELRSFSAKLMTLTAHVIRIDSNASKAFTTVNKKFTAIDAQIAQMLEVVTLLAQKFGVEAPTAAAPPVAPTAPTAQPQPKTAAPTPTAPVQVAPVAVEEEVDEEEEAAVARLIAETQAEVDAINGTSPGVSQ